MIKAGTSEWWSNFITYLVFSVLLGIFGIDRFYKGDIALGVVKLIFFWIFVWWIVDVCIFAYRLGATGQWVKASPAAV